MTDPVALITAGRIHVLDDGSGGGVSGSDPIGSLIIDDELSAALLNGANGLKGKINGNGDMGGFTNGDDEVKGFTGDE
jgi:hypothetical protein